jgi:hypothetical protein
MVDLIPKHAGQFSANSLTDALMIGGVKVVEERALSGVIGNGTLKSGAIKLFAGSVLSGAVKGKSGHIVSSALAIDGIEDLVNGILSAATGSGAVGGNQSEGAW